MGQHHTSDLAQGAFRNAGGLRIDIACRHWKTRLSCCRARGSFCWWPPGLVSIFAAFGAPVICLSPLPKGSGRGTLGGGSWSYQCWFGVLPTTTYIYIYIYDLVSHVVPCCIRSMVIPLITSQINLRNEDDKTIISFNQTTLSHRHTPEITRTSNICNMMMIN